MDIMRPPLEQQVSPTPWLISHKNVDVPSLLIRTLTQSPDATVDEVVDKLRGCGVQVSGIIVATWMSRWREHMAATRIAED